MFNVSDYLKKFTRIEGDSLQLSDSIKASIYESTKIDKVSFDIKKDTLYIKGSPVMKNLIHMKKAAIIEAIKAKYPKSVIRDIR